MLVGADVMQATYTVTHDPYGNIDAGTVITLRELPLLAADHPHDLDGVEFVRGGALWRMYHGIRWRINARGDMVLIGSKKIVWEL